MRAGRPTVDFEADRALPRLSMIERLDVPMYVRASLVAVAVASLCVSGWWLARPRPTLEGAAVAIDRGRFRAAETQLRAYLSAYPSDETATLLLAKVLVRRPEPATEEALRLVEGLRPADVHRAAMVRAIEGDAHFWNGAYKRAEAAWLEALERELSIPEVGWKLLNIYAIQGRDEDSRRLALRLLAVEPDKRDRVQLLLHLIRRDAHPIEQGSIIQALEPVVRADPSDVRSSVALGLALVGSGRFEEGIARLRRDAYLQGGDEETRLAFLEGLIAVGDVDDLEKSIAGLPTTMAASSRFDAARGWLAAQRRDLDEAIKLDRRALDVRPTPPARANTALAHRFRNVLRQAGKEAELAELGPRLDAMIQFPDVVRGFFDRLNDLPDLGLDSHPNEYCKLAAVLAEVGRDEEAEAWRSLAKRHDRPAASK
jgi:tetratricopeptide (TPR) repeat protein